jgi:CoA:oxalate CoA-transferase
MTGILDGIRVVDMTIWQQGPYSTAMLADLGADVIHIEGPTSPDVGRNFGGGPAENGLNPYFQSHNRGKRSLVIDLKDERGRAAFHKLVETADVFVSNMRRSALKRLGADYETLSQVNPQLIHARASGYGPKGPDADLGAMDILGQARGGIMMANGEADGRPRNVGAAIADHVGAITLGFGIMSALVHRLRTGEGQQIDSSLLGSQMCIQSFAITGVLFNGNRPLVRRSKDRMEARPTWNTYKGSDGKWFASGSANDSTWPNFCAALERPDWLTDSRYSEMSVRNRNGRELITELDQIFATQPAAHWVKRLSEAGALACTVNEYHDLLDDPQTTANEYITEVERDDGLPPVKMVGAPVTFSKTPAKIRRLAPEFDQHTEEILLELGYTWEEMESLRRAGVIGAPSDAPTNVQAATI